MRTLILAAGFAALVFVEAASAQSLQRCRDIYDDSDRLACYDQGFDQPENYAAVPAQGHLSETSNYDGFYIGAGIQQGAALPALHAFNGPGSGVQPFDQNTPTPFAFVGYDWASSGYIYGVEVSFTGDPAREPIYSSGDNTLQELIAPMISARAGVELEQLMLFARAGVGSALWEMRVDSGLGTVTTTNFTSLSAGYGVGAEVAFDPFFVRLSADVRHVFLAPILSRIGPEDTPHTTYKAGASVGVRFD